jgi:hypothetical protein
MNRATPKMRVFAGRLIACEATQKRDRGTKTPAIFPVPEKLRPHLTTFMGNAGFRALLLRALALAGAEVPWLRAVQVSSAGSLEVSHELAEKVAAKEIIEGGVVLLAQLLGLMVAFIGEKLTLQLVRDIWPRLSIKELNGSKGDSS